mgnify:CR=1 FL=1
MVAVDMIVKPSFTRPDLARTCCVHYIALPSYAVDLVLL